MTRLKPPQATLLASADDVEAQFYEALQQGDVNRLMTLWADDDEIVCVHPSGVRAVGAAAIRASFEAIFANGGVPAVPDQVRRVLSLGVAVHHLLERVRVPPSQQQVAAEAWVVATNVYVNTAQGWRLVAHHASPAVTEQPGAATEWPSTLH